MPIELNLATVLATMASQHPERTAIIQGEQTVSYGVLADRVNAVARLLVDHGLGCHVERLSLIHI